MGSTLTEHTAGELLFIASPVTNTSLVSEEPPMQPTLLIDSSGPSYPSTLLLPAYGDIVRYLSGQSLHQLGGIELSCTESVAYGAGTPVAIAARHHDPRPQDVDLREERVKPLEGGTLGYEGPSHEKPRNKESGIEEQGHQELYERPSEKPPEQIRAKVEHKVKSPQRRHIRGPYPNYPTASPLKSQNTFFAVCTRCGRGTDGDDSGVSGGANHTSVPIPTGTRGPGNEPVSMGMLNIDEKDLGLRADDGEWSTGTDDRADSQSEEVNWR